MRIVYTLDPARSVYEFSFLAGMEHFNFVPMDLDSGEVGYGMDIGEVYSGEVGYGNLHVIFKVHHSTVTTRPHAKILI